MLACICPGSSSAEHSLNTLRYAERLKDRPNPSVSVITETHTSAFYPSALDEQL